MLADLSAAQYSDAVNSQIDISGYSYTDSASLWSSLPHDSRIGKSELIYCQPFTNDWGARINHPVLRYCDRPGLDFDVELEFSLSKASAILAHKAPVRYR